MSIPDDVKAHARKFMMKHINDGYAPQAVHEYRNESNDIVYWKARAKHPETGIKKYVYMHRIEGRFIASKPILAGGDPLYKLNEITTRTTEDVWIVEGEMCADRLIKEGILATTSGGKESAAKTNWEPLKGRKVIVWPDNDEAGAKYSDKVAEILKSLGCTLEQVELTHLNLAEGEDCVDWFSKNTEATRDDVLKFSRYSLHTKEVVEVRENVNGNQLRVVDLQELLSMEIPVREKILSWMPAQSLSMIHAWRGVGKTHVALGISYAIASGGEFLKWKALKKTKVLYVDGEMPASAIQERLARIVASADIEAPSGGLRVLTPDLQESGIPDLATNEGQKILDQIVGDAEVIVLDNLSCLVRGAGKENDAESWINVQQWALKHRSEGRSILFIHHSGKGGGQRGTSKKEDVLDTVICLTHSADYDFVEGASFEVHYEKARHLYGEEMRPFVAQLVNANDKQHWETKLLDDTTYEKIVKLCNEGIAQKDIAEELEVNKSTVSRHIKRGKQSGDIKRKNNNDIFTSKRGVDEDEQENFNF